MIKIEKTKKTRRSLMLVAEPQKFDNKLNNVEEFKYIFGSNGDDIIDKERFEIYQFICERYKFNTKDFIIYHYNIMAHNMRYSLEEIASWFNETRQSIHQRRQNVIENIKFTTIKENQIMQTDINNIKIKELTQNARVIQFLTKNNIFILQDLLKFSKKELLKIKNLGIGSILEIEKILSKFDLHLK